MSAPGTTPNEPCADAGTHIPRSPLQANFTVELGFARKPFAEQLALQGLPFDAGTIEHLDRDAEAVSRLKCRSVIGYAAGNKLYDKIAKLVWVEVKRAIGAGAQSGSVGTDAAEVSGDSSGEEQ